MWRDPIVEEVRGYREQYAARFNYDIKAICRDARERQQKSGRKIVSFAAKRPLSVPSHDQAPSGN